jgi:hypothetical protein
MLVLLDKDGKPVVGGESFVSRFAAADAAASEGCTAPSSSSSSPASAGVASLARLEELALQYCLITTAHGKDAAGAKVTPRINPGHIDQRKRRRLTRNSLVTSSLMAWGCGFRGLLRCSLQTRASERNAEGRSPVHAEGRATPAKRCGPRLEVEEAEHRIVVGP